MIRLFLMMSLIGAALLAGCGGDKSKPVLQGVQITKNGDFTEGAPVRFEDAKLQRLAELRQQEHLDRLVDPSRSQFENILAVKDWVAEQWPHSTPDPYPPWDAITILDWIRSGKTGGFCGQYSQVMLQALTSLGFRARYMEIGTVDNPWAHFVVEVWSNDFDKWVMLDADFNVHFMRRGVPQSALDLHQALVEGTTQQIDAVLGSARTGHDDPHIYPERTIEFYYYLRLLLNANQLTAPDEPAIDRYNDAVEWSDAKTVSWDQSTVASIYDKTRLTNLTVSDAGQFTAKLNQTRVTVESVADGAANLFFETTLPDSLCYQVIEYETSTGYMRNLWGCQTGPRFIWHPVPGRALMVSAKSATYQQGPFTVNIQAIFDR